MVIDSGIGRGKLNDKLKRNFGVLEESKVEDSLGEVGLTLEDIDIVLMTHLHFDHANGLTKPDGDDLVSTFPNATIYTSKVEWDEMRNPNMRSKNTYWEENWKPVQHQVKTLKLRLRLHRVLRCITRAGTVTAIRSLNLKTGMSHLFIWQI